MISVSLNKISWLILNASVFGKSPAKRHQKQLSLKGGLPKEAPGIRLQPSQECDKLLPSPKLKKLKLPKPRGWWLPRSLKKIFFFWGD